METNNRELKLNTEEEGKKKKSVKREIAELAFIALILVPLINIFVLQSYAIPTSSMESEMLVGDKLFVSKLHFGPRIPQTPLALPYVHNSIFGIKSYTEAVKLPYMRLPGFSKIKRNNIVVFNYPTDHTLGFPVDKRTNYVKRCVGMPGDNLEVREGYVYIDGKKEPERKSLQFHHNLFTGGKPLNKRRMEEAIGKPEPVCPPGQVGGGCLPTTMGRSYHISAEMAEKAKQLSGVDSIARFLHPEGRAGIAGVKHSNWNRDFFGPIYLPKKGDKIKLDTMNYLLYETAIRIYENNPNLKWNNQEQKAYLNGKVIDEYTFKMNYYFMMGDNRHNSADSRFWGFVPEDHIVGKPVFVWLSTDKDADGWLSWIRWGKTFRFVK